MAESRRMLPRDDQRRSALIVAVDNAIWVSFNEGAAQDLQGTSGAGGAFYLPANLCIPVLCKGQVWMSATTVASTSSAHVSPIHARANFVR